MPRPDSRLPCFARPANFSTTIILHRHPSSLAPLRYPFFFPSLFLTVVCSGIIGTPRIERFLLSEVLPAQANLAKVPWFNPRPSSPLSLCPLRVVSAYSSIHDLRSRNVKKGLGGCFIPLLRNRYVYCFLPDRLSRTPSPPFRPVSLLLHRSSACSPPPPCRLDRLPPYLRFVLSQCQLFPIRGGFHIQPETQRLSTHSRFLPTASIHKQVRM